MEVAMKKTRYFILCSIVFLLSFFWLGGRNEVKAPPVEEQIITQIPLKATQIIQIEDTEEVITNPNQSSMNNNEVLIKANYIIGEFSTNFSKSSDSRKKNIRNAARKIHLVVIYPGEEFSICEYLVPFTAENGYYPAGTIVNGKVINGLGGGVCQVSTTLYNAVLDAELTVLERHAHSMTVSYIQIGRDAAIAENLKDFRFLNSLDTPIVIETVITSYDTLIFRLRTIKQIKDEHRVVTFETKIIEEIPPGEPVVEYDATKPQNYICVTQSAYTGYKAEVYRVVTIDEVEVERVKINYSEYEASPQYMIIGKK